MLEQSSIFSVYPELLQLFWSYKGLFFTLHAVEELAIGFGEF